MLKKECFIANAQKVKCFLACTVQWSQLVILNSRECPLLGSLTGPESTVISDSLNIIADVVVIESEEVWGAVRALETFIQLIYYNTTTDKVTLTDGGMDSELSFKILTSSLVPFYGIFTARLCGKVMFSYCLSVCVSVCSGYNF